MKSFHHSSSRGSISISLCPHKLPSSTKILASIGSLLILLLTIISIIIFFCSSEAFLYILQTSEELLFNKFFNVLSSIRVSYTPSSSHSSTKSLSAIYKNPLAIDCGIFATIVLASLSEKEIESQLDFSNIDADVLKVGHHGSKSSSSTGFINAVSPDIAVISVGEGNSYGHPNSETIALLNQVGADVYRTDEQGTIVVTADKNKKITVDKKASTVKENAPPVVVQTPTESVQNETPVVDNQSQVVYRTNTGKKYHRSGCSYLKSKIETTVSGAKAMGLEPCSRCNPPS